MRWHRLKPAHPQAVHSLCEFMPHLEPKFSCQNMELIVRPLLDKNYYEKNRSFTDKEIADLIYPD